MSAGMAAKVQTKTHFLGSMMDPNNGSFNGMWDAYHEDRNRGYNSFLMSQTRDGRPRYLKEQTRLTILEQEKIFRHQLQELHRLYKIQKDLMSKFTMKEHYKSTVPIGAANSSIFVSQISSQISRETHTQRRVIDLELPANLDEDDEQHPAVKHVHNLSTKRAYNLADLNEPICVEEASFAASVINKSSDYCVTNSKFWYLQAEPKKALEPLSRNRKVFGVELSESSHKPSFDSSQSSSWDQNAPSLNHNRWIEPCEKHVVFDRKKNHENLEKQLPHWLMKAKGNEMTLYQMNLDSLQQNSEQFFKKAEKVQNGITKILGVPVIDVQDSANLTHDKNAENDDSKHIVESKQDIDLNMSFDEEEEDHSSTPNIPKTVVKMASLEIDLETPAALEPEPDDVIMDADDQELVKSAVEAIISISSSEPPPADTLLWWLAEVIASGDGLKDSVNANKDEDCIPEDMDYFEYMTLNLQETKEKYHCYEAVIVAEKEEDGGSLRKRAARKGQGKRGRPRKDFQRDVLPGIVSLSRREVTEDLQIFEDAFNSIGVSWQSKRKPVGKNGRGRPRLVVATPPSPPTVVLAVEKSVNIPVALGEKSLSGWGKKTRRMPRQRCQNGGNHHSLALEC